MTSDDLSKTREKEIAVGITQFVNKINSGFAGVLKQRYTDFLVNEITPDGEVLHITNLKAPGREQTKQIPNASDGVAEAATDDGTSNKTATTADVVISESSPVVPEKSSMTSLPTPSRTQEPLQNVPDKETHSSRESDTFCLTEEDAALLDSYFDKHTREQLVKLYEKIVASPAAKPFTFGSLNTPPMADRSLRGQMHQNIRRMFNSVLETTVDDDSTIKVSCAPRRNAKARGQGNTDTNNQNGYQHKQKGKVDWKELGGEHLHFSLYKENKDTMEIINFLSFKSKTPCRQFAFAGTKDRRAVTVQRVSVHRKHAQDLAKLNRDLHNALIGNFKYMPHKLELGELAGNEFLITLRDCKFGEDSFLSMEERVTAAENVVGEALQSMHKHGFINYFGLQRFGSFDIGTDAVGKKILQGDFEGAVKAILHYQPAALAAAEQSQDARATTLPRDDIARAKAINVWEMTGKAQAALENLPRKFSGEISIIHHLSRSKTDFSGALLAISRNLRLMYVHAYQSLVWNVVASHRWALFGDRVMPGDLIIIGTKEGSSKSEAKTSDEEFDENGELIVRPAADDFAKSADDIFERARPLNQEEAESGVYTIFDIVLPLPGFDVEYPQNEVGDYYKEFMASERGGGLDPADMRRSVKDFSLSGSYRKLLSSINKTATYEVRTYTDDNTQMVVTDLEKLRKADPRAVNPENHRVGSHNQSNARHQDGSDARHNHSRDHGSRGRGGRGGRGRRGGRGDRDGASSGRFDSRRRRPSQETFEEDIARVEALRAEDVAIQRAEESASKAALEAHTKLEEEAREARKQSQAAWANAAHLIPASERAEAAKFASDKSTNASSDSGPVHAQPAFKEKYIETDAVAGHRTGRVEESLMSAKTSENTAPGLISVAQGTKRAMDAASYESNKLPKLDNQDISSTVATTGTAANGSDVSGAIGEQTVRLRGGGDDGDTMVVDEEVSKPLKLAVIIKFQLGTSQYATMALRELMKDGNVKAFKPDFSGGRG